MESFSLQGNWVDLVIILVLIYFLAVGWTVGFWFILSDFFSFLFSILIALWGYQFVAGILRSNFSLSHSVSNAIGFLFTAVLVEGILNFLFTKAIKKIPKKFWNKTWNKLLGLLPAFFEGFIIIAFVLTLLIGFPISGKIKSDISDSKLGGLIINKTVGVEAKINDIFGGVIDDSLTYLIVQPGSGERVEIPILDKPQLSVDEQSESEMIALVNQERNKRGIDELTLRPELVPVARAHAVDMWERGYFAHVSPEGLDVGDRLGEANVTFFVAGENLAFAPTLLTAHTGLMNSPGHRANILEPAFKRIGIGVIDGGIYGKLFVQIFTD